MMTRIFYKKANIAIRSTFARFFKASSTSGLLLLVCAIVSLLCANIPELRGFHEFWKTDVGFTIGDFSINMPLDIWINDALMAIFFFVVGLEIKREMLVGELSSIKQAALPIFAALGGMLMPALIYTAFNYGTDTHHGWGIPMATDIAFAVGVISLLGKRCPMSLKVFLMALAIVDDIGAIIVLAIFYPSHDIELVYLLYAAIVMLVLLLFNRARITSPLMYVIPGVFLWYFIFRSGIHATISGVLLAMCIPSETTINELRFSVRMRHLMKRFTEYSGSNVAVLANHQQQETIHAMKYQVDAVTPLMHRFESSIGPYVNFLIMPLFALANAGVVISPETLNPELLSTMGLGIFFGLTIGKPLGIFTFSYLSVKLRLAAPPAGVKWSQVLSVGVIAGIGFTMSIFIDNLAFDDEIAIGLGKITILVASLVSALLGLFYMHLTNRKTEE